MIEAVSKLHMFQFLTPSPVIIDPNPVLTELDQGRPFHALDALKMNPQHTKEWSESLLSAPSRDIARSSIWKLIFNLEDAIKLPSTLADASSPVGFRLGNNLAHKLIKDGITSRVIEPVGAFLGLSKTLFASYLELDRGTGQASCRKGSKPSDTRCGKRFATIGIGRDGGREF